MAESRNGSDGDGKSKADNKCGDRYYISPGVFSQRLNCLYKCWADHKLEWSRADAVAVLTPKYEIMPYLKSFALNFWLLGYEFPDTLMVFMQGALHFLCSQRKAKILEAIKGPARSCGIDVVLHVKQRGDDGSSQMEEILEAIKSSRRWGSLPVVGVLSKEPLEGSFMEKWAGILSGSGFTQVDVAAGLCDLFSVKDESEINHIQKAAFLSASASDFVVTKLDHVIAEEERITHSELMDQTMAAIMDPVAKLNVKLRSDSTELCYRPIFQSGCGLDLKPSVVSNHDPLCYDTNAVIICALGVRYNNYCSNVARSYLINPEETQEKAYRALVMAQKAAINSLVPGNLLCEVYKAACSVMEHEAPELVLAMTTSAGAGMGIELWESGLSLNETNKKVIKAGMVFNVKLGLQNLKVKNGGPKTCIYSLLIADTVVVQEGDKRPKVLTESSFKGFSNIAYQFRDSDEEPDEKPTPRSKPASDDAGLRLMAMNMALRSHNCGSSGAWVRCLDETQEWEVVWHVQQQSAELTLLVEMVLGACLDVGSQRAMPTAPDLVPWEEVVEVIKIYEEALVGPGRKDLRALEHVAEQHRVLDGGVGGGAVVAEGEEFRYRTELVAIGLHPEHVRGIGTSMVEVGGGRAERVASAFCADSENAHYIDHVGETVDYEGQGTQMYNVENQAVLRSMVWGAGEVEITEEGDSFNVRVSRRCGPTLPVRLVYGGKKEGVKFFRYCGEFTVESVGYTPWLGEAGSGKVRSTLEKKPR